jgi:TolA-binding protein
VRTITYLVEVIKTIQKHLMGGSEQSRTSSVYMVETERGQRVLNSAAGIAGFQAALNLFKKSKYGGKSDDFENFIRLRPTGENVSRTLTLISHFMNHE